MLDAFFNAPVGMVVYSLAVFGGLIFAIWSIGYLVARVIEAWLD
jgi:hypothetical protein